MPTPKQAMMMCQPSEIAICARAAARSAGEVAAASRSGTGLLPVGALSGGSCPCPGQDSALSGRYRDNRRMATRRIGIAERRARLGVRHLLAARAETALEVADALVALHGTDPASVYLSAAARMRAPDVAAIEREIYDERRLV